MRVIPAPTECSEENCGAAPLENQELCVVHVLQTRDLFLSDDRYARIEDVAASAAQLNRWAKAVGQTTTSLQLIRCAITDWDEVLTLSEPVQSITLDDPASPAMIWFKNTRAGVVPQVILRNLSKDVSVRAPRLSLAVVAPRTCAVTAGQGEDLSVQLGFDGRSNVSTRRADVSLSADGGTFVADRAPLVDATFTGVWGRIDLPAGHRHKMRSLILRDVTLGRWPLIKKNIDVIGLERVKAEDLEITAVTAEHLWIRDSKITELHGNPVSAHSFWIEGTEIAGRCTIRGIQGGEFGLIRCTLNGPVTLAGGHIGPELMSVAGSVFEETAPLTIEGQARLVNADGAVFGARARIGSELEALPVQIHGLKSKEDVTLHVSQGPRGAKTEVDGVQATRPWRIRTYPADPPISELVTVVIRDSQFDKSLTITGTGAKTEGRGEQLRLEGTVSADAIHLSYLDLALTKFAPASSSDVRLGAGNRFFRARFRCRIFDETSEQQPDQKRLGNIYRELRQSLEGTSDAGLANDFYIGESKARAARRDARLTERAVLASYGVFGGWGVRPSRPALWLLLVLGAVMYGAFHGGIPLNPNDDLKRISITLESLLPWARPTIRNVQYDSTFQMLLTPARVLVLLLAGFVAIGLRSHVRR